MRQRENKYQDGRLKPKDSKHYIKYKWNKHSIIKQSKKEGPNYMLFFKEIYFKYKNTDWLTVKEYKKLYQKMLVCLY